jgi:hypothetical protein
MEAHIIEKVSHWVLRDIIYFKEGEVSWILNKDDLSLQKDVILGVKAPSLYGSNI